MLWQIALGIGGLLALVAVGAVAWLGFSRRKADRLQREVDDYENAEDIRRAADRARTPDRVRRFDDAGWRPTGAADERRRK